MYYDPQIVINIALAEVGYLEKETWDQLDDPTANAGDENYNKYSRDLAKVNFYNSSKKGVAWCDIFVDWCFYVAYGLEAALMLLCQTLRSTGAGCKYSRNFYKKKGQLHESDPLPGDQIFFWPKDRSDPEAVQHTGLVYKVDSTYVYTVEGNTSSESGVVWNGGAVARKKYRLNYERIAGYGRPNYGNPNETENTGDDDMAVNYGYVTSDNGKSVNFRKSPNTKASRITRHPDLDVGTQVEILGVEGEWTKIKYDNYTGYMLSKYITTVQTPNSEDAGSVDNLIMEIKKAINDLLIMVNNLETQI